MTGSPPATTVTDSRRLTGPSLVLDRPGAVLEIHLDDAAVERAVELWRDAARRLLGEVGWAGESLAVRRFAGGASLALSAPIDALYAAVDLNEAAWDEAAATLAGHPSPSTRPRGRATPPRHRGGAPAGARGHARRRPGARRHLPRRRGSGQRRLRDGRPRLAGGRSAGAVAGGLGAACTTCRWRSSPVRTGRPRWCACSRPCWRRRGGRSGFTSTDGVHLGGTTLDEGDYSGPSGARLLLRHAQLEAAVLETARGGLLRRGLSVDRAAVAVVTNIADDHLGEFGVQDIETLADVKLLVARPVAGRRRRRAQRGRSPAPGARRRRWPGRSCGSRSSPRGPRSRGTSRRAAARRCSRTARWCWRKAPPGRPWRG